MSADELADLVNELKLTKHSEKLENAGVLTLNDLLRLEDAGVTALGLPKGPTVRLRAKITELRDAMGGAPPPASVAEPVVPQTSSSSSSSMCPICVERPSNRRADCSGAHEFCVECIEGWKKQTVMKPDKGTRCPMCRQTITCLINLETGQPDVHFRLGWGGVAAPAEVPVRAAAPIGGGAAAQQQRVAAAAARPPAAPVRAPAAVQPPGIVGGAPAAAPPANGARADGAWRSPSLEEHRATTQLEQEIRDKGAELEASRRDASHASSQAYEARRIAQQLKEALTKAEETMRTDRTTFESVFAAERAQRQQIEQRLLEERGRYSGVERDFRRLSESEADLKRGYESKHLELEAAQRQAARLEVSLKEQTAELRQLRLTVASAQSRQTNIGWNVRKRQEALEAQQAAVTASQRGAQVGQQPPQRQQQQQFQQPQQQQYQQQQFQQPPAQQQQQFPVDPPLANVPQSFLQPGSNPKQWSCASCTFANALHRTQRTPAGLCICELCNMTSRLVE